MCHQTTSHMFNLYSHNLVEITIGFVAQLVHGAYSLIKNNLKNSRL
jgi:hypothetical protein